jgi:hypothetical protein
MIDSKTEALYGAMPLNRKLVAEVIQKLAAADVKGIVLKFFYDLPSSEESDRALEKSICAAPVALQAAFDAREGTTNSLDAKFQFPGALPPGLLSGEKGLIPLSRFLQCAQGVGFVDHTAVNEVPLIEFYQGAMVKSLYLVALEMSNDCNARIDRSGNIYLDKQRFAKVSNGRHAVTLPVSNSLQYIPFHEILAGADKDWKSKVRNTVVIVGYDGKSIHSFDTSLGPVTAHRFFIFALMSLAKSLADENRN